MRTAESTKTRTIVGRLERGDKLPDALLAVARAHGVKAGRLTAIGGVTNLKVTEYDIHENRYTPPLERAGMTEVLSLAGNLSLRDGAPFFHLHLCGSWQENGETRIIAGHLVEAETFVCEFHLVAYDDVALVRDLDPKTGLALWDLPG
jgi:hypothetical protein